MGDESQVASELSVNDLQTESRRNEETAFRALLDVSMPVIIEIGRTSMTIQQVLQLGVGSVIELDRSVGEPIDIFVSDRKLGQGEVVVVGEHFGVRITHLSTDPDEGAES